LKRPIRPGDHLARGCVLGALLQFANACFPIVVVMTALIRGHAGSGARAGLGDWVAEKGFTES
jgi:hypothetical protein